MQTFKHLIIKYLNNMIQSVEITKWKNSTQMASRVNDHETGFADVIINKEEVYADLNTSHYYIVMIISGEVNISCKLYRKKIKKRRIEHPKLNSYIVPRDSN